MVICLFVSPVPCGTRTHMCMQCTYMRTHTLDLRGQQAPLTGLQSHVSATSLQPQRREVCVKHLSRAVTADRFVGLSPQADFTGVPVGSSCMGPTARKGGASTLHPVPSSPAPGKPGPLLGALGRSHDLSELQFPHLFSGPHPLCLPGQAGFVAQVGQ